MFMGRHYFDGFKFAPWNWQVKRNDEYSGLGDGRIFQAQMAPPLWMADIELFRCPNTVAERFNARVRALEGAANSFTISNPLFCGPMSDPHGKKLGPGYEVDLFDIKNGRRTISLENLPVGYQLSAGDKFTVSAVVDNVTSKRQVFYMGEFQADKTASKNGFIVDMPIFPMLPLYVEENAQIELLKPDCEVVIEPGSFDGGSINGNMTSGIKFTVVQKK